MTHKTIALVFLVALLPAAVVGAAEPAEDKPVPKAPDQAELEKQFEETLSGATLVGFFTLTGTEKDRGLKEERYTINKVTKLQNDYWRFDARIQYGDHDVTLPLPLKVKWAGDTPVITLTDLAIPGLGTYTSRVLIYRGQYAGTWSGGDHGGQLFGRIEKRQDEAQK